MRTSFKYEITRDEFGNKINKESGLVIEITLNKNEDEDKAFDFAKKLGKEIGLSINGLYEEEGKTLTAGWYQMDREEYEELKEIYKDFKATYEYNPKKEEPKTEEEIALNKAIEELNGKEVEASSCKEGFMMTCIECFLKGGIVILCNKKQRKLFAKTIRFLQSVLREGKIESKYKHKILTLKL